MPIRNKTPRTVFLIVPSSERFTAGCRLHPELDKNAYSTPVLRLEPKPATHSQGCVPHGRVVGIRCVHNGNFFPGVVCQLHTEVADEMADTLSLVAGGKGEDCSPARFRWIDPAQFLDERQISSTRLEAFLIDAANIAGDARQHFRRHAIRQGLEE